MKITWIGHACLKLVGQVQPVIVLPMHYRSRGFGFDVIGTLDQYLELCNDVVHYDGSELEICPGMERQTAVLMPQNEA